MPGAIPGAYVCFAHDLSDLTDCEIRQSVRKAHIRIRKHSIGPGICPGQVQADRGCLSCFNSLGRRRGLLSLLDYMSLSSVREPAEACGCERGL